jgi:hypothetical protein
VKRSTWVLLAAVAALLAAILLWEQRVPTTGERETGQLTIFDPSVAKATELSRVGEAPLRLRKGAEDRWSLTAPVADLADRYAVEGLLERLAQARALRFLPPGTPIAELGLDKPRASWTFQGEDGKVRVEVGRKAAFDEGLYLRANGVLALVPRDLESLLLGPADDFRLKNLTAAATQEIKSFAIVAAGKPTLCARRDSWGGWEVTAPYEDWGASDQIEPMLDDLSLCLVDTFVAAGLDGRAAGLVPPQRGVRLVMEKGPAVDISLGGPVPGGDPARDLIYASVSGRPSPVTVSANSLKTLSRDPESLRSLKLFRHDAYESAELIVRGTRSVSLNRAKEGAWRVSGADPASQGSDPGGLAAAVSGLTGEKFLPWLGPSTPGFGRAELTLTLKGDRFEETVEVGSENEGRRLAHPKGRPVVLLLTHEGWATADVALNLACGEVAPHTVGAPGSGPRGAGLPEKIP